MGSQPAIMYGAGGHAKVLLDICAALNLKMDVMVVDKPQTDTFRGVPVQPGAWLETQTGYRFFVAIGTNKIRKDLFNKLSLQGIPFNLVHPSAILSPSARIGKGVAIMPGVVVNGDSIIGNNVILNTLCSVDHDCVLEDHVHLAPGVRLAGNVKIGSGTLLGVGTSVIPGISIGRDCTIGAGSVVVRDIPDGSTAFGNPAKVKNL